MADLLLGQVLSFDGDPFVLGPEAGRMNEAVLVDDGRIAAVGSAASLRAAHPQARVTDYGQHLISAGFVDAHVHYPQTAIIASWGKRLIDWLNQYTFPEEMRFADPAYAAEVAARYFDLALAHGTTSMCSYATIHPASVDAFLNRRKGGACGLLRAKPAWTATRPRVCAIQPKVLMTTAKPCLPNGMAAIVCLTSSPRAFRRPRHPINWPLWGRCGGRTPIA